MKHDKPRPSASIEHAVGRAVNYEVTIADLARRSERRAWRVAGCSMVLSLMLGGGYFYVLPLKEKVPYLIMADAYSGTASVAQLAGNFGTNSITVNDAVNRSNVAHYVLARESYDIALMNLRDWTVVYTMSAPQVANGYTTANSSHNPESPFRLYGKTKAIRVQINSIQMIGGSASTPPKGATVRFQRSLYDKASGHTEFLDSRIATMEFTYKENLRMSEKHRIENPLGFQVLQYRVDNDFGGLPPPAIHAAARRPVSEAGEPPGMQADAMPVHDDGAVAAHATGATPE